ncbi:hypothetical protein AXF42_Ash003004 [Apostasia shenzhenica]|uniref:Uncharacterized protein n=1 Tax=Apostasia shenzhenica TaxID=1088818 RepID=A0A2I0A7Y1_9ASPA|nr:hypothetical protein AXF42_Ash003004 [Apostasia shenzhenica]
MVAQEDGDTGGGGEKSWSSTKKGKPNKVPQRGLGIAALEKLRREENQRRLAAAGADVAGGSSSENSAAGVIFHSLPPRACYIGNYALFRPPLDCGDGSAPFVWSSIQSDGPSNPHSRLPLLPRRQPPPEHQQQQTYSLVAVSSSFCISSPKRLMKFLHEFLCYSRR